MILKEIYNKHGKEIVEATCDICGADCMKTSFIGLNDGDRDDVDNIKEFEGMILNANWGYYSNKDGEVWEAVICEDCVEKEFNNIKFLKKYCD